MEDPFSNYAAFSFLDFRRRLIDEFRTRRKKNARYSLRAYARLFAVDPATLQKLLNGKRALGTKTIRNFGGKLRLPLKEIESYCDFHSERRKLGSSLKNDEHRLTYKVLGEQHAAIISQIEYLTITQLVLVPGFELTASSAAAALGITVARARELIATILDAGFLEQDASGKFHNRLGSATTDPTDPRMNLARQELMQSIIRQSLESYTDVNLKARSVHYGRTVLFDRKLTGKVLEKIRIFADDLERFIEKEGDINDVYQIQLGFYPLTKI